ncbi:MAG: zf-HC2 domain-containing protein [Lachnospiraceae bacterium]|nr:zf-HC2 domain-containing protein [Lachnospiraceae bacterium]
MDFMDCRYYRKNYSRFLNGKLEGKERRLLLRHINECAECREELRIQYLMQEGMRRLEHGGTLDINSDFERMLFDVQKEISHERRRGLFLRVVMTVCLGVSYYFLVKGILG